MRKRTNEKVQVGNLLVVVETAKAYGVVQIPDIKENFNTEAVTSIKEVTDKMQLYLMWIPKSQVSDEEFEDAADVFPNMNTQYKSKFNDTITPYKTRVSLKISKWIAEEKGLVEREGEDGMPEPEEGNTAGW